MYDDYWEGQLRYGRTEPHLEDVGTREKHYLDLLELWKNTLEMTEQRPLHTEGVEQVIKELKTAISLLERQLTLHPGYDSSSSRFYDRILTQ